MAKKRPNKFIYYHGEELRIIAGVVVLNIVAWSLVFFGHIMNAEGDMSTVPFEDSTNLERFATAIPVSIAIIGFAVVIALFEGNLELIRMGLLGSGIVWFITILWMWDIGNFWYAFPLKLTILTSICTIGIFSLAYLLEYLDKKYETNCSDCGKVLKVNNSFGTYTCDKCVEGW